MEADHNAVVVEDVEVELERSCGIVDSSVRMPCRHSDPRVGFLSS